MRALQAPDAGCEADVSERAGEAGRPMAPVTLTVRGQPAPKGSRTLGRRRDGSTFTRPASNAEHRWVDAVAREAMAARARTGALEPPYAVELRFAMPRPARPAHPHPTRTDLDKLTRAVLDGLARGRLIADDRHVIELWATKCWAPEPGVEGATVTVTQHVVVPLEDFTELLGAKAVGR